MRILLLSKADIQGCLNINGLVEALADTHQLDVLLSDALLAAERGNRYADICTWYDRDYVLERFFPAIDALHDKGAAPASLHTFSGLKKRCASLERIPTHDPHGFLAHRLTQLQPELIICCRFDYILKGEELHIPRYGVVNTHSGLAPDNVGPNATFRAMYRRLSYSGCTVHWASETVDGGAILAQPRLPLAYSRSLFWNRRNVYAAGLADLVALLPQIEQGTAPVLQQNPGLRHYYPYPTEQEFAAFIDQGQQLYMDAEYQATLRNFIPPGLSMDMSTMPPAAGVA